MKNKNYLLAMLMLTTAFSYFDRFVFSIMLEPIKSDLSLSDIQVGIITGLGFSVFYATAGIPIARWADRSDRIKISSLGVGLLGLTVSLCGSVVNFIQLLLVRAGVAVGEAGLVPTSHSLIADNFERIDRPRAMAYLSMSYSLSVIAGYLIGGWLVESVGWRLTFVCIGLPGILIAIGFRLTLEDTFRNFPSRRSPNDQDMLVVFKYLWAQKTFYHILIAFCAGYFFFMGMLQWLGAFFMRSHNLGPAELGGWLALSWGLFGLVGTYLGGVYATRFAAGNEQKQMRSIAISIVLYFIFSVNVFLTSDKYIALIFLALSAGTISFANGPIFSTIQCLVQDNMRSTTVALLFLFSNLIGMGLGPLAVGVASDLLQPFYQDHSLRYALLLFCPGSLWVAYHYWRAGATVDGDIVKAKMQSKLDEEDWVK